MSIEIEYNLTGAAKEYGMYTELGNAAVGAIEVAAKANNLTWAQTLKALSKLAEQDNFAEAMDTAVREYVYDALGIQDENFYV